MPNLKHEIMLFLSKIWVWGLLILIGVIAKFSYDVSVNKKFTFATFFSTLGIAAFVGYLSSAYCIYKGWDNAGKIIVPIATLISRELLQIIIANAYKWAKKLFPSPKDHDE